MKKYILAVIIFFTFSSKIIPEDKVHIPDKELLNEINNLYKNLILRKKFNILLDALSMRESTMNPDTVNTLGYIGEFQFGKAALEDVGLEYITFEKFKENPKIFPKALQRKAMTKLIKLNLKRLEKYISKYEGRSTKNIVITESGLIAAAHLSGAGNVKKFLRTNGEHDPNDGHTKLSDYLREFAGYDLAFVY